MPWKIRKDQPPFEFRSRFPSGRRPPRVVAEDALYPEIWNTSSINSEYQNNPAIVAASGRRASRSSRTTRSAAAGDRTPRFASPSPMRRRPGTGRVTSFLACRSPPSQLGGSPTPFDAAPCTSARLRVIGRERHAIGEASMTNRDATPRAQTIDARRTTPRRRLAYRRRPPWVIVATVRAPVDPGRREVRP